MKDFFKNYLLLKKIDSHALRILLLCLITIISLGTILFVISFISTGMQEGFFRRDFCFHNSCILNFTKGYSQSILILQATFILLGLVASIGGIIVALLGYTNSVSVSALGNHISHFKIFQEYLSYEINKRDRLSASSFDIFKWYNIIFNKSRSGSTSISQDYCNLILKINSTISDSNTACSQAKSGSFSYVKHQNKITTLLRDFGIIQPRLPRNDYYEVEDQVFELIDNINREFCYSSSIEPLVKRLYR
ncbi:retron Ec48 family effector membrane protein [Enterobacter bugandensis]|uniref:retron Ec48 family effector membrane protein n=2 Tax=Enterobacter TaxID=547 RepID=UPI001C5B8E8F|nr:retron Ec48 family effector membrane protein [Enterobacter bugandensis]MBW4190957.1 retron Ec48 family effector membrane protein [Enterobacter bugandensis]MCK7134564.1 retron Ec48 family effector membrane protein [Enterobacter bugandensis]MCK7314613.1 retron Ec48 family effector membrane protein [Enterobacter bugandensis]MCU6217755.1 retron Ec48 family effector membrane protein [Enterobacter bugandensis]